MKFVAHSDSCMISHSKTQGLKTAVVFFLMVLGVGLASWIVLLVLFGVFHAIADDGWCWCDLEVQLGC